MSFFFNIESLSESFGELFITKTPKDQDSFYMSTNISKYEKTGVGYINTYYCNTIRDTGAFFIIINSKFANAIFAISKTNRMDNGVINKLCNSGDDLDILWDQGEYPYLQFTCKDNKTKKLEFYIKVVTSF